MDTNTLNQLTSCLDRAAIENQLGLYCRAIDRLDIVLLRSVYHPDAVDDHGAIKANAHEFAEQIISMLGDLCVYTMHTVTHSVIDVTGNTATSESYYLAVHTIAPGREAVSKFFGDAYADTQQAAGLIDRRHEYLCSGRYLDQWQKRGENWRIASRRITNEWGVCRPEQMVSEGVPGAFTLTGSRDREDPVYKLLQG